MSDPANGVLIGEPQHDEKDDENAQYRSENDQQISRMPLETSGMHEV
jgi:hypothetical protein